MSDDWMKMPIRQEYGCAFCGDMGLIPVLEFALKVPYRQNYACRCQAGDRMHKGKKWAYDGKTFEMIVFFERFFDKFEDDGIGLDARVAANHAAVRAAREAGQVAGCEKVAV